MKRVLILGLLVLLLLTACNKEDKVEGSIIAELEETTIANGETTTIRVKGTNTGNVAAQVLLKFIPEDEEKVVINYSGTLSELLYPGEDTGMKLVSVRGYTDYSSTEYYIKVQLINQVTKELLEETTQWLTVVK